MYIKMPTVFILGKFKFIIRTKDHSPPHVHVVYANCECKIVIENLKLIKNRGFSKHEITVLTKTIASYRDVFQKAWEFIHEKDE